MCLGRKLEPDTWTSTHSLQLEGPLGLPYILLESLDPTVVHKRIPFPRDQQPRWWAGSIPKTSGLCPAGLPLGWGLSLRCWAIRLFCPSPALRSNHHESCKASLLKSQKNRISALPPVPSVDRDIEASMRKGSKLSKHSAALRQSQD